MAALTSAFLPKTLSSSSQLVAQTHISQGAGNGSSSAVVRPSVLKVEAMKVIQGTVVKTCNDKTAAVDVKRIYAHPLYKKRITTVKRYQAHDPENKCKVGDIVTLEKCAPVSKTKKFVIASIQPPRIAGERAAAARAAAEAVEAAELAAIEAGRAELKGASAQGEDLPPFESDSVSFV